ncbi:helix-turn-helix domain-containing protein [Paracoccaceae bacterium Fryx2]|nr:helix-turn-helix domain-containing protein [Paracoccaceae bacterium Fryx2]
MTDLPPPPAHVEPFVRILGSAGAIEFLLEFGGAEMHFSGNPTGRSRLVQAVGPERAAALAAASHGLPARVPTAKPWIAQSLRAKGLPVEEIARRLHMSNVAVRRWLKSGAGIGGGRVDPRQLPLI